MDLRSAEVLLSASIAIFFSIIIVSMSRGVLDLKKLATMCAYLLRYILSYNWIFLTGAASIRPEINLKAFNFKESSIVTIKKCPTSQRVGVVIHLCLKAVYAYKSM